MPETLAIGMLVAGSIFMLIGILGGDFSIFGAKISKTISNPALRWTSGFLGGFLCLISISIFFANSTSIDSASFSASSFCSIKNVYGYGESSSVEAAQNAAIGDCIRKGGVPDCCASDVRVSQE